MKLAYEVAGAGAPVVLLHNILASADTWSAQVRDLATRYRVIAIDARGHGRSPHATTPFTIGDMVDDTVGVLDELGIDCAVWAGLSMGGMVALAGAVKAPQRVRALVLLDTDAGPAGFGDRMQYRIMSAVAAVVGVRPLVSPIIALSLGPTTRRTRPDIVADWSARIRNAHVPSARRAIAAVAGREDLRARLRDIAVPTLVIVGEEDPTFPPPVARGIASGIPGARLIVIPGSGHVSYAEQPEAVTHAMRAFLDTLPV